jgi:sporulation protein YlmC with PRC-barrel domain
MSKIATAALISALAAVPAFAQTAPGAAPGATPRGPAMTAPATHDTSGSPTANGYNTASARNPIMTDDGGMRTSKIVGSSVYNDHNEKVGSIDDVVIGQDKTLNAVVSVGGFLGMGSKMVEVPFDKLQFGNTKGSSDNRVVMPGVTKDSLNGMPDYHYQKNG